MYLGGSGGQKLDSSQPYTWAAGWVLGEEEEAFFEETIAYGEH